MRKVGVLVIAFCLAISFSFSAADVEAAGPKIVEFANCKELNKVYRGGVAKSASVKNKGGKTKYKPFVSEALYKANAKSDRDKDLIACER
ncbi:excalibur calcium-binding domain-containing protein [Sporosarcina sp. 179-K 3D1 HS]|uniref:excalibur calcium-binding domain-containing protein n=1 Tax=Sporosarcina sp. 179-K 3D1 HS TaxID=3232169 RepID=UPI00399EEAD9